MSGNRHIHLAHVNQAFGIRNFPGIQIDDGAGQGKAVAGSNHCGQCSLPLRPIGSDRRIGPQRSSPGEPKGCVDRFIGGKFVCVDGVGFANVYGGDDEIIVRLANIAIKPAASTGLGDPIGASRLNANFKAKRDPRMVKSLVAKTKQNNAAAAASMDTISPPARHPGP